MEELDIFLNGLLEDKKSMAECNTQKSEKALNKSAFLLLVKRYKDDKERNKINNIKRLEHEAKSYIVDKMIYNKKRRDRRKYR